MTADQRFKTAVRQVVADGEYPSPTRINRALVKLGAKREGAPNNINGKECRWRAEALRALGWRYDPSLRPRTWAPR